MRTGNSKSRGLRQENGYLETGGGRLFFQKWLPESPQQIMVVAHGLGEHSGRYGNLVDYFVPRGYGILALDHRGHGRSSGVRGHVDSFVDYREDLAAFVRQVLRETGREKVILVGHSLGGLIAAGYGLRYPETLLCLVLSSPALRTHKPPPRVKAGLGRVLAHVAPRLLMRNEIDPSHISRDAAVVKAYVADPLVHDRVSPRFFVEFLKETERVFQDAGRLSVPLLLLQAGEDFLVSPAASREFFERAGSREKELKVYPGHYHEIFNEPEKEQVFQDMLAWLNKAGVARPVSPSASSSRA